MFNRRAVNFKRPIGMAMGADRFTLHTVISASRRSTAATSPSTTQLICVASPVKS